MKNAVTITAKETAKIIRKVLKEKYPETKFSVTSEITGSRDNVTVAYRSGAEPEGIREYLEQFQSTHYNMMDDYHELTGFKYEGTHYCGADYIFYSKY